MRRHERVIKLGFRDYADYLASPVWRAVKARYRASGMPHECMCGERDVQLHHLTYDRVGGDERNEDLVPLCRRCHAMAHSLEARGVIELDLHGLYDARRAAAHREQIRLAEEQRAVKRELFHALPLDERVRRLREANARNGFVINKELRRLEQVVARAESRALKLPPERLDLAVRKYEERLTSAEPSSLDDLLPESVDRVVLRAVAAPIPDDCDGSMTCDCPRCRAEVEARVGRGVRSRRTTANALRSIERKAA